MRTSPGIANTMGSALTASVRWPVGASQSSQARHSTIKATADPAASVRVHAMAAGSAVGKRVVRRIVLMMPAMSPLPPLNETPVVAGRFFKKLQRWPWLGTLLTLVRRFREDRLALTASSLTFTSVISLVPLATVMLALFTAFPMFSTLQDTLQHYFVTSLVPDSIAKPVLGYVTQFSSRASRLGVVGLVALVISAIALMLTIDRALNAIWRVRTPRPIAQRVLVYWSAITLGPLLLAVSVTATSIALTASRGLTGAMPPGLGLIVGTLEFVVIAGSVAALFH